MGGDGNGVAALTIAPAWDRFAHWSKVPARLLLAALALLLVASALVPIRADNLKQATDANSGTDKTEVIGGKAARGGDLGLYDTVVDRVRGGENYYDFIVTIQREEYYSVRPGLAVRLPTLAYIQAAMGSVGQFAAAILLVITVLLVWWRRLGAEPGGKPRQLLGIGLLFFGASWALNSYFFVVHELWTGLLLALSFGLHRPGQWLAALLVAALALAIRETALPFVLLMGAMAFWRRDWREVAAWAALVLVFAIMLQWHVQIVDSKVLPSDSAALGWLYFRGLSGWLSNVVYSSNLQYAPHWLAGPLAVLCLFGWSGWRCAAGDFATLLFLGYMLLFMIAGRPDNFYWGAVVAPAMFIGLAFVPTAFKSLVRSASWRGDLA